MNITDKQASLLINLVALQDLGLISNGGYFYCEGDMHNLTTEEIPGTVTEEGKRLVDDIKRTGRKLIP